MGWDHPQIFGGCPVTAYELLRDDGNGSDVDIIIDVNDVPLRPDLY